MVFYHTCLGTENTSPHKLGWHQIQNISLEYGIAVRQANFNSFMPDGFFYHHTLDWSSPRFRDVRLYFILSICSKVAFYYANSVGSDQCLFANVLTFTGMTDIFFLLIRACESLDFSIFFIFMSNTNVMLSWVEHENYFL